MKTLFIFFITGCMLMLMGAAPSIGVVKSTGEFRVDGSMINGNSTVFEGNLIETTAARSVVQLNQVQITLLPGSRAKVYRDHTILEQGAGLVRDGAAHMIEAATLRIAPSAKEGLVQVEMTGPKTVSVFARTGAAEVRNSSGVLVAALRPGMAVAFTPQIGTNNSVTMTGTVLSQGGKFYLTDETTHVKFEIRGSNLAQQVGKRVQVRGSSLPGETAANGASSVVEVQTITGIGAAGAAGGAAGGAGLSGGTIAIIGGVAAAGTLGGLAAAGTFSSEPSVSR